MTAREGPGVGAVIHFPLSMEHGAFHFTFFVVQFSFYNWMGNEQNTMGNAINYPVGV
jgi:hypothetical protein